MQTQCPHSPIWEQLGTTGAPTPRSPADARCRQRACRCSASLHPDARITSENSDGAQSLCKAHRAVTLSSRERRARDTWQMVEARNQEKKRFIDLADRLARSRDPEEQTRIKEEL